MERDPQCRLEFLLILEHVCDKPKRRLLIGAIDRDATGDGAIVSCDGFRAGRLTPEDFASLAATRGVDAEIVDFDDSSVFCEITAL